MLPNIDQALYARFKAEGYRIKRYKKLPVTSIPEIVRLAYLDVNRTLWGIDSEQSQSLKQTGVSLIEHLLASPPKNQPQFDELHHRSCQQCLACVSPGGATIHYGQAQKLLNMSLKYLYNEFAAYYGNQNQFGFPDNIEHLFHLPIDRQTRNHLVGRCHFADPTSLPWSQWAYDHYIAFQNQLRDRIRSHFKPLEIDYMLWNTKGVSIDNAIASNLSA